MVAALSLPRSVSSKFNAKRDRGSVVSVFALSFCLATIGVTIFIFMLQSRPCMSGSKAKQAA